MKANVWRVSFADYHTTEGGFVAKVTAWKHEKYGYSFYIATAAPPPRRDRMVPVPERHGTLCRLIDAAVARQGAVPAYALSDAVREVMEGDRDADRVANLLARSTD